MGAWAELQLDQQTLKGIRPLDQTEEITSEREGQAKELVEIVVVPMVAEHVAQKGSPEAFFDACAEAEALQTQLQAMLAYAYSYFDFADKGGRPASGRGPTSKAHEFYNPATGKGLLKQAATAFARLAPVVLGQTTRPSGSVSAALASTMDRYGRS